MPRDDEKHRHRNPDFGDDAAADGKDRDQKAHAKQGKRKDEHSSKRRRQRHDLPSDEEEAKHRKDSKKSRRGDDEDNQRSSSLQGSHRHRSKSSHRHPRKREESSDRKKTERKSDDRKKKKRIRKQSELEASTDDDKPRKKSSERAKSSRLDKSKLYTMGNPVGSSPATLIDPEKDYFTYHQEFWIYLFREEGVRFNDLQSTEAREAFGRFASMYNDGKLESPYYGNPPTFPRQVLEESKTTRHKWGFQTTETERKGLEQLQEGVRRQTQYSQTGDRILDGTTDGNRGNTSERKRVTDRDL